MSHAPGSARRIIANTSALSAAGLWRIGVAFALQLLVARSLGAAGLGAFALNLALLNVAQVVVEAGLPALLVRDLAPADVTPGRRRATFTLARRVMLAIAVALAGAVALAALLLWPAGWAGALPLALLFASLPFYALMAAALAMCEAAERFELVLLVDGLTNALLLAATALALALGGGLLSTFVALVAVQALSALLALAQLPRLAAWLDHGAADSPRPADENARALVRRAAPTFGVAITDVLQQRLDLLLVGAFLAPAATGFYAAAAGLVRVLLKLAQTWWRSLFPTLSRLHSQAAAQARQLDEIAQRLGLAAVLLAALLLTTAAQPIVILLFGADYADAAPLLRVLAWSAPFYFLVARAVVLLLVAQQSRHALAVALIHVGALLFLVAAVLLGGRAALAAPAVVAAAAVAALAGARLLSALPTEAGQELVNRSAQSMRSFALVAAAALIAWAAGVLPAGWIAQSAAAAGALFLLYGLTSTVTRADLQRLARALRTPALPPPA